VIQAAPLERREALMALLDEATRREVAALLAYSEDNAGGLMNPRYVRVRPDMTVDEAISYVRKQMRELTRTIYYVFVLDSEQRLMGVVSFSALFNASVRARVSDIMRTQVITIPEQMDQETVAQKFAQSRLLALPVVDVKGRMQGIVTADDVADVVREEATEDMQKVGGVEALDAPYLEIDMSRMIRKRVGWLCVLFLGEMLTASAMGFFEKEIARAVVLALFIPLIISSGGNSGSQATTLVIRAMALGEVRLRDWWRVVRREFFSGLTLGVILADYLGWGESGLAVQAAAVCAALAGAALLRWTERRWPEVQEALIGVAFVLASSGAILLLAHNPHGGESLKDLLSGQILWVTRTQLAAAALVTLLIAAAWWIVRRNPSRTGGRRRVNRGQRRRSTSTRPRRGSCGSAAAGPDETARSGSSSSRSASPITTVVATAR